MVKIIRYALDSNTISFRIKKNPIVLNNFAKADANEWIVRIPPFAYYEVKRGLLFSGASKRMSQFEELCKQYPVSKLDDSILEDAIKVYLELHRKGMNVDDMDIFIAAWCIANGFTLVTNNTAHFQQISGLSIVDWSVEK